MYALLFFGAIVVRASPPNLVMIVVDDLGYATTSCTGLVKDVQTPNIDRLAERGVRFAMDSATSLINADSRSSMALTPATASRAEPNTT